MIIQLLRREETRWHTQMFSKRMDCRLIGFDVQRVDESNCTLSRAICFKCPGDQFDQFTGLAIALAPHPECEALGVIHKF